MARATPDETAQAIASDHAVPGAAGLVGGSSPLARRHPARSALRVAAPAAMPLTVPNTFHTIRRSATKLFSPDCRPRNRGYALGMSNPEPPQPGRDLADDEPDLLTDDQLEEATPVLPDLDTDPAPFMHAVPPGPETPVSPLHEAGEVVPVDTLEEMADAVEEGRLPD